MENAIEVVESKLYAGAVADEIVALIQDAISDHGSCSLVLSGGSTPGAIYRILSKPPRVGEVSWDKVRLYLGDERWVSRDDNQSNAKMVQEALLADIPVPGPKFYPVDTSLPSPEQGARIYASLIRDVEGLRAEEFPTFDIVLLGMGEDGHTASLFPGSAALASGWEKRSDLCSAVIHPTLGGSRVSMTAPALFGARRILFIVKGEGKATMLKRVLRGRDDFQTLPARLYTTAKGQVTWYLDSEAAQQIA